MRVIATICLTISLGMAAELALAATQLSFLIKSQEVSNTAEALTILRRFMPTKLKPDERCEKYAVVLNSITRAHLDQFKLAEIGLESSEQTRQKFRAIDVETLRQLYIDGINTFRGNHIDSSMLELTDCLSKKFRTLDAKARSFLNSQELQEMLRQYKSVMSQPLNFLVEPAAKHPDLTYKELTPAVKLTLTNIFNQDTARVKSRFQDSEPATPQEPLVEASSNVVVPESVAPPPAPVAPVVAPPVVTPPVAAPVAPVAPVVAPPAVAPPAAVANESPENQPVSPEEILNAEDFELLHNIVSSLHEVYNKLPVNAKLGDRCQAYHQIIQADQEHLKGRLVDTVVQETANKLATSGPSDLMFNPDENARENFLFILSSFPKEDVGHETWIDLVDCVSEWADEDPKVRDFMNSPEQAQILNELMKTPDNDAPQMASPSASVATARAGALNHA